MIFNGLYAKLINEPTVAALLSTPPSAAVHYSLAPKDGAGQRPYVVIHVLNAPPAEATLDGSSDLVEGELQFDCYADDQISARKLSRAVRDVLKNYQDSLPDNTVISSCEVTMDLDDPYEVGGGGYLFRSLFRLRAFYTEAP